MHKHIELGTSNFDILLGDEYSTLQFRDGVNSRRKSLLGRSYYPQQYGVSELGKLDIQYRVKQQLLIRERERLIAETRRLDSRSQARKQQQSSRRPQSCRASSGPYDKLYSSVKITKNPENDIQKCKSVASCQKTSSTKLNNQLLKTNKFNQTKIHYTRDPSLDDKDFFNDRVRCSQQKQEKKGVNNYEIKKLTKDQQIYQMEIKLLKQQLEQKNKIIVDLKWMKSKQPNIKTKELACQTEGSIIKKHKVLNIGSKIQYSVESFKKQKNNFTVSKLATVSVQKVDDQSQVKSEAKETKQSFFTKSDNKIFNIQNSELKHDLFDQNQSSLSISVPMSYNEPEFGLPTQSKFEMAKKESITESVEFNHQSNESNTQIQFNLSNSDASYAILGVNRAVKKQNLDDLTLSTSQLPLMNSINRFKQPESQFKSTQEQKSSHLLNVTAQKLRRASYGEQMRVPSTIEEEDSKIEEQSNVLYCSN